MFRIRFGLAILFILLTNVASTMGQEPSSESGTSHEKPSEAPQYTNALIRETSPYLLQHAHNPVDWLPWGPEAFKKAKRESKPIFVSVGYSTCYWCHVMERESFEQEDVAKVLNKSYVCIKVDREERPEVDEQLMLATQLMTGRGGWPNSVWLTSDGRPWLAGTYFPKDAFILNLERLAKVYREQPEAIEKQANLLVEAIAEASSVEGPVNSNLNRMSFDKLLMQLEQTFDFEQGGFGTQPKFPPHGMLHVLVSAASEESSAATPTALKMLTKTLDAMWCGGVHDHVGGGFHRYSTDDRWFLPHFEKMLYDNAQLMRAYTEAYVITKSPTYQRAVEDIFGWLQREMTHPDGGFFSALDSESEDGEEGRFYTWSMQELTAALGKAEAERFARFYHFETDGNYAEEATGKRPGTNIPFLKSSQIETRQAAISESVKKLREMRTRREYPHLDDKVLTAWNGLMVSALARAGHVFDEPKYTTAAESAAEFVLANLQDDEGSLLRSWRLEKAILPGYLNDYAFFVEGLLELHETTGLQDWNTEAQRLADQMLDLFEDKAEGGFFFTSSKSGIFLVRSKNLLGSGNLPNGNGVAVQILLKLAQKSAPEKSVVYERSAKRTLECFADLMLKSPRQVEHLVLANWQYLNQVGEQAKSNSNADAADNSGPVTASLFLSHLQIEPAEELQVAVKLEIDPRYHLYLNSVESVRSARIEVESMGWEVVSRQDPASKKVIDQVLNQQLNILEGNVLFFMTLKPSDAKQELNAERELRLSVKFQACDDSRCLAPDSIELRQLIKIDQERPNAVRRHESIFGERR